MVKNRPCSTCGKLFNSNRHNAKFCSEECKAIEARKRREELKAERAGKHTPDE